MRDRGASMGFSGALVVLTLAIVSACTTTEAVKLSPQELQQNIVNGWVIDPGDSATITTRDGARHCCRVHSIGSESVEMHVVAQKPGEADAGFTTDYEVETQTVELISIPISDIVAVDKTELTPAGEAATAAGGVAALAGFWYVILIVLPALLVAAAL